MSNDLTEQDFLIVFIAVILYYVQALDLCAALLRCLDTNLIHLLICTQTTLRKRTHKLPAFFIALEWIINAIQDMLNLADSQQTRHRCQRKHASGSDITILIPHRLQISLPLRPLLPGEPYHAVQHERQHLPHVANDDLEARIRVEEPAGKQPRDVRAGFGMPAPAKGVQAGGYGAGVGRNPWPSLDLARSGAGRS